MGLGAGWAEIEYRAYGIDFPSVGRAWTSWRRGSPSSAALLRTRRRRSRGRWFLDRRPQRAAPVQDALPIWVGGSGEKRTLRIAARFADGWNVPFVSPETFAAKRQVLYRHCDDVGRDPAEIRCAVNLGLAWTEDSLRQQFGRIAEFVRPACSAGPSTRSSTASASTSRPAPTRSTSRCGAVRRRRPRAVQRAADLSEPSR